jgi:hypothetical protein
MATAHPTKKPFQLKKKIGGEKFKKSVKVRTGGAQRVLAHAAPRQKKPAFAFLYFPRRISFVLLEKADFSGFFWRVYLFTVSRKIL